ncbi:hypothetical protein DMH02_006250 [Streptomyces sp. WAC 00631]|nr:MULTISPECIES: hypothetical protein [unclassified Streptomyces]MCC5032847.1 hypothetical protein [Streptomyces sp. WAC 00631]MCC9740930.1 hypothetical protein [Streptomyces sp. MNU89]
MTRTKRLLTACAAAAALALAVAAPAAADNHSTGGTATPQDNHTTVFPTR